MKRYGNFLIEVEEGIFFEISDEDNGNSIIKIKKGPTDNGYSTNYMNPPIPNGYRHIYGKWNEGFVIKRDKDGSELVWVPVGSLKSNGTLDNENFNEKFGRRNYRNVIFSKNGFHENVSYKQILSVKKYGGFYISSYIISKSSEGKPQSVKGAMPWVNVNRDEAIKIATMFEDSETVKGHLAWGAEYDSVLEWFIETEARSFEEIAEDSSIWGNHWNIFSPKKILTTGYCEEFCTNNIYDFSGNVDEWTQEQCKDLYGVIRGGNYNISGMDCPAAYRNCVETDSCFEDTGFRIALYIE